MNVLYQIGYYSFSPLLLLYHWWQVVKGQAHRGTLAERMATNPISITTECIWIHAASVGEVNAAVSLIERLLLDLPNKTLLLTTQTQTGLGQIKALFQQRVICQLIPLDLSMVMQRFIDRVHPKCVIVLETELWPNMIRCCSDNAIPIVIANARISDRAYKRYRRIPGLCQQYLSKLDYVLAQSEQDNQRFLILGADVTSIETAGNLKYALRLDDTTQQKATQMRQNLGPRLVFMAASTHNNEEAIILNAFKKIKRQSPDAVLILVPRHPHRVPDVLAECHDFKTVLRSQYSNHQDCDILLVDTIGECFMFYGCADIAFIGGSLVDVGGHNPVEPGLWGIPILCGPYTQNFRAIMFDFERLNAITTVKTADQIAKSVLDYSKQPKDKRRAAKKVQQLIATNANSLERHLDIIKKIVQ